MSRQNPLHPINFNKKGKPVNPMTAQSVQGMAPLRFLTAVSTADLTFPILLASATMCSAKAFCFPMQRPISARTLNSKLTLIGGKK